MPGRRQDGGFTLRSHCTEEINRLVMCIGQSHRHNHVSRPHIESRMNKTGDMKLLQGHFTPFFHFRFIFAVFRVLQLHGRPSSSGFKFDFCAQNPFRSKLIIHCQHKARNRNCVPMITGVSIGITVITIDAIILKTGHSFSIASHTKMGIFIIVRTLFACCYISTHFSHLHRINFTGRNSSYGTAKSG